VEEVSCWLSERPAEDEGRPASSPGQEVSETRALLGALREVRKTYPSFGIRIFLSTVPPGRYYRVMAETPSDIKIERACATKLERIPHLPRDLFRNPMLDHYSASGRWIASYDVPITAALPSLAAQISRADIPNTACARRILAANHRLGGAHRALELARIAAEDHHQDKFRIEALQLLSDWVEAPGPDRVHGAWWPVESHDAADLPLACAKLLEARILSAPDKIATAYLALAETAEHAASSPAIAALVADTSRKGRLRARALSSLQSLGADELRSSVDLALQSTDSKLRAAGLGHLRKIDPALALAGAESALSTNDIAVRRAAYTVLGALADPQTIELLTAEVLRLSRGEVPAAVSLELIRAAESKDSEALRTALASRKAAETDAALAKWIDSLEGGDAERGEHLFLSNAELSCLRCHRTEETAEPAVGPTLTNLSERLTRRDLLISLVDPNRTIAESYESWTLLLTDDTVLAGRILSEDETNLVLINSDGKVYDVAPAEIAERKRGLSSMPEGLSGFLTRAEMRDLIEYLATL
jgi:quinoprotein glucose dehydrogenase